MPTEKNLDISFESELEFKPYSPSFDTFKKEPVTFLLVNALKYLTEDQRKQLYKALGERLFPPPASAEDEAARLYKYSRDKNDWLVKAQRQAHITCAGMYTGEIDKLRNALQDLVDAVPKQQVNVDWWDDSMSAAMKQAQELLK